MGSLKQPATTAGGTAISHCRKALDPRLTHVSDALGDENLHRRLTPARPSGGGTQQSTEGGRRSDPYQHFRIEIDVGAVDEGLQQHLSLRWRRALPYTSEVTD